MDLEPLTGRLRTYVGAGRAGAGTEDYVKECAAEAIELVGKHVGTATVPPVILARAVMECGSDLYYRKQARSGVATFDSEGALETVRIGLDPMRAARVTLAPFLPPVIA